jgi:uncharacterized integral membrane protein
MNNKQELLLLWEIVSNMNFIWGIAIGSMISLILIAIFFPNNDDNDERNLGI